MAVWAGGRNQHPCRGVGLGALPEPGQKLSRQKLSRPPAPKPGFSL